MSAVRCPSLALAAALFAAGAASADVKPASPFTDHMVLQQGIACPIWGTADPGEEVTVTLETLPPQKTKSDDKGNWMVKLPALKVGNGSGTITIAGKNTVKLTDVMVGEVWVCSGQSNMEWPLQATDNAKDAIDAATNPNLRLFTVKKAASATPLTKVDGKWALCTPETAKGFSAVAYFFGRDLQKKLGVPVGLIHTSWGGTPAEAWTSREALKAAPELGHYLEKFDEAVTAYDHEKEDVKFKEAQAKFKEALDLWEKAVAKAKEEGKPEPQKPRPPVHSNIPDKSPNSPTTLYNAMIAPLVPYGIKGAIWYQGESNAGRAKEYRTLFPTMISDWRARWGEGDFPFLFVQLAPWQPGGNGWPELCEAQLLTTFTLPKTGMAVITDVGNKTDIHPKKKEPVGGRLALAALGIAYGEKLEFSGPIYKSMTVEGNKAVLTFDHVGSGLEARDGELKGFTIAGKDGKFVPAKAEIRGDTVVVSCPDITEPTAVRYGWSSFPEVNLWNKDGLPASPFRTDVPK